jgi:hypothetical protein
MVRPQEMIDVGERRLRQCAQRFALDDDELMISGALHPHAVGGQLAIARRILAEREQRRVFVRGGDLGGCVHGDPGLECCKCSRAGAQRNRITRIAILLCPGE